MSLALAQPGQPLPAGASTFDYLAPLKPVAAAVCLLILAAVLLALARWLGRK